MNFVCTESCMPLNAREPSQSPLVFLEAWVLNVLKKTAMQGIVQRNEYHYISYTNKGQYLHNDLHNNMKNNNTTMSIKYHTKRLCKIHYYTGIPCSSHIFMYYLNK